MGWIGGPEPPWPRASDSLHPLRRPTAPVIDCHRLRLALRPMLIPEEPHVSGSPVGDVVSCVMELVAVLLELALLAGGCLWDFVTVVAGRIDR